MESIVNPPVIRMELIRDLALHLDYQKSLRPDGIYARVLREMTEVIAKLLSTICQSTWSSGEVLRGFDACQLDTSLQEELEGRSGELQACLPWCLERLYHLE